MRIGTAALHPLRKMSLRRMGDRAVLLLLGGSFFLTACGDLPPPPPSPRIKVTAVQVVPRSTRLSLELPGLTQGFRTVELRARVEATLEKQAFQEGTQVSEGELLVQLDPRPFRIELEKAQAALLAAQSAKKTAATNLQRARKLLKKGFFSAQDLDVRDNTFKDALAQEKVAQANVKKAALDLSYTRITAPFTGMASSLSRYAGSLVSQGAVLTTLTQLHPLKVVFGLSEPVWLELQKQIDGLENLEASLVLPDGTAYGEQGTVTFMDTQINPKTGVLEMWALFPNAQAHLKAGLCVRVKLVYGAPVEAIFIPQKAVLQEPRGPFVFVANGKMQAEKRWITGSPWDAQTFRVTQGIQAGEKVLVDGILTVRDRIPLEVTAVEQQAQSAQG